MRFSCRSGRAHRDVGLRPDGPARGRVRDGVPGAAARGGGSGGVGAGDRAPNPWYLRSRRTRPGASPALSVRVASPRRTPEPAGGFANVRWAQVILASDPIDRPMPFVSYLRRPGPVRGGAGTLRTRAIEWPILWTMPEPRVLIVDDEPDMVDSCVRTRRRPPPTISAASQFAITSPSASTPATRSRFKPSSPARRATPMAFTIPS